MRASADELSAWEALMVTLVVRIVFFFLNSFNDEHYCIIHRDVCDSWIETVPILARDACITWKKKLCPLDLLAPIVGVCQWRV